MFSYQITREEVRFPAPSKCRIEFDHFRGPKHEGVGPKERPFVAPEKKCDFKDILHKNLRFGWLFFNSAGRFKIDYKASQKKTGNTRANDR